MVKNILCAAAIFIVMSAYSIYGQEAKTVPADPKVEKYFFSGQDTEYFSDDHGRCLMELRSDGRYTNLSYFSKDEGTWQQLKDGRIRLASEIRYNYIYTDELSLIIFSKEVLEQLPTIRKRLTGLLDGNNRESYSIHEIKDASKCVYNKNESATLGTFAKQQEYSRTDVADLIAAIETYLKDDEKNAFYLHAYHYPQYGFSMDDFSSYSGPLQLVENIERDNIKVPAVPLIEGYIGRLNSLLKVRGLSRHFSNLKLSDEAMSLLEREAELDEPDLMRLNSLLLEAAYPLICPEYKPDRKAIFLFEDTKKIEDLDKVIKTIDSGRVPQLTLRLVDKSRYDMALRKKQEDNLAFARSREERRKTLAKKTSLPPAETDTYFLPEGKPDYFALRLIHTSYLVLKPDGQYRETVSDHFDTGETDRGEWKQLPEGRIRMVSIKLQKHYIESGSLSVYVQHKEDVGCLKALKEQITGFLNKNDNKIFTRSDIRGITKNQAKSCGSLDIDINIVAKTTSRNNLKRLIPRIDRYLQNPEKNVIYYSPYTYRDTRFMVESADLKNPEYLGYVKEWIDEKESVPIYVGIDAATFDEGSKKPQPFVYRPEGNEMVKKLREKYKKTDE